MTALQKNLLELFALMKMKSAVRMNGDVAVENVEVSLFYVTQWRTVRMAVMRKEVSVSPSLLSGWWVETM